MSDQTTPRPVSNRVAVGSMELFDYREGYKRMAEYVAAHLDARVKSEFRVSDLQRENARLRGAISPKMLASALVESGVVDSLAIEDKEGYDGYRTWDAIRNASEIILSNALLTDPPCKKQ